jgi:hypothetical protein
MAAPNQEPPAEPDLAEPRHESAAAPERYGPLLLERYRKADGRHLILYERVGDDG